MVGTTDAFLGVIMRTNGIVTGKFVMLLGIGCAIMLASAKDASANRIALPPTINLAIVAVQAAFKNPLRVYDRTGKVIETH
jgi:hypothetical protein